MTVNKVEKKEKSIVEVTITITAEEFEAAVQQAYFKNKNQIMVPGFRKGKAPRKVIEGMYGSKVFYEDALEIALPNHARDAFIAEKLIVVGYPDFKDVDFAENGDLTFVAGVPVFPEVTLGEYKGVTAYKAPVEVTEEDIDAAIEQMRQRNARQVSVDRAIENGDTAIIDFEGFKEGVPFEGGKGTNHPLTIGSGSFVPGFEEQLIGKKAGEEVTVALTFPEDYHADLAGAAVEFKVTIHEVKTTELPELDDEFAKDVSEFDTMAELRLDQKTKLAEKKAEQAQSNFREEAIRVARENMTVDIPDVMVEDQLDAMMNQFANSLQQQGFSVEQYTQIIGITMEQMRETYRPMAREHVLSDLMLHAVADAENLEVTDEEADAEYEVIAQTYGVDLEEVKKNIAVTSLKEDLRQRKAADFVVDNAVATDVAPVEEKAEEEKKPVKKTTKKTTKTAAEGEEAAEKKP
ncbi:MAG: trigger factor, partial [Oscillospiraceae bacterium]|nr:trigger factor [Oscillospiraceae bacterium]